MPAFRRQLIDAVHIDRLNLGPVPTTQLNWLQPHEGNLIEFLFRARAFQTADCSERSFRSPPAPRGCIAAAARATTRWRWSCWRAATRSRCCRSTRRPIRTRRNVSEKRVLFGGISIYLQQYAAALPEDAALSRPAAGTPRWVINAFATPLDLDRSAAARRADDLDARRGARRAAQGVRQAARVDRRRAGARRRSTCRTRC